MKKPTDIALMDLKLGDLIIFDTLSSFNQPKQRRRVAGLSGNTAYVGYGGEEVYPIDFNQIKWVITRW